MGAPLAPTIPRPSAPVVVAVVLVPALFGSMAATPYQFGVGQPLLAYIKIPRDWAASVPSSPLFKARHGFSADTPIQFGVGQPLPVVAVFPRDWSTYVPTSPPRFGTWGLADTLPTYGQPIAPQVTIPAALTAVILNAVRYGITIDPGPPLGYGQPIAPRFTIPGTPALAAILEAVRYGVTIDPGAPPGYGQPIAPRFTIPAAPPLTVALLEAVRYGITIDPGPPLGYGQPLQAFITSPRDRSSFVPASPLRPVRFGVTADLVPRQFGYGVPTGPRISLPPFIVIIVGPTLVPPLSTVFLSDGTMVTFTSDNGIRFAVETDDGRRTTQSTQSLSYTENLNP